MTDPGDLVVVDYQLEIRGKLHGATTPIDTGPDGWTGLGSPGVKPSRFDLPKDGAYLGPDRLTSRILTFPLVWGGTPAEVMLELDELVAAWDPQPTADLLPLYFMLPGWGRCHVFGHPRGIAEDLVMMPKGEGAGLATFEAGDPTIHRDPPP